MTKIFIDIDMTLNNFAEHFYKYAYEKLDAPVEGDIYENYDLTSCLKVKPFDARRILREVFSDRNFWKTLPIMKNAHDVLSQLQKKYELHIVTAVPFGYDHTVKQMVKEEKVLWLTNNLFNINFKSITFVDSSKKSIGGFDDYIIDDNPDAVKGSKCKWIKMKYGYNKDIPAHHTVLNWKDIQNFFNNI